MSVYENKRNAFDPFKNSKWNSSWILTTHYSLGSPSSFESDGKASAPADRFCEINVSHIFVLQLTPLAGQHKPSDRNG